MTAEQLATEHIGETTVGVVSANDLVAAEDKVNSQRAEFALSSFWDAGLTLPVHVYEEKLAAVRSKIAPVSQQPVERFMTTNLVSVEDTDSLSDIVQKMVDGHIHRVVVLDKQQQLVGLITTMDVLARLINAGRMADLASDN